MFRRFFSPFYRQDILTAAATTTTITTITTITTTPTTITVNDYT
jgi:hypothetical protein